MQTKKTAKEYNAEGWAKFLKENEVTCVEVTFTNKGDKKQTNATLIPGHCKIREAGDVDGKGENIHVGGQMTLTPGKVQVGMNITPHGSTKYHCGGK